MTTPHATQGEGDEEEAKRRRQSARGYQKKFHSSHGDAITALNVLCAFEQSPSPESFCRSAAQQQRLPPTPSKPSLPAPSPPTLPLLLPSHMCSHLSAVAAYMACCCHVKQRYRYHEAASRLGLESADAGSPPPPPPAKKRIHPHPTPSCTSQV